MCEVGFNNSPQDNTPYREQGQADESYFVVSVWGNMTLVLGLRGNTCLVFKTREKGKTGVAYWFYTAGLRLEQRFKPVFSTTLTRTLKTLLRTPNSLSRFY